jgi:tRNA A-37 threonylcarbamoyl transferase component Bud32
VTDPHRAGAEPFASGREADVFLLDDRRVLRRYRRDADVAGEAAIMEYVAGFGFPVPEVYAVRGPEMVMERLDGPTLMQAGLAGIVSLTECAAVLADLLRRLHELPARSGTGTIVHLDLHPENILLTSRGPVVIDWPNGRDGPGDLDSALTALILAQVATESVEHPLSVSAGAVLDRFLELAPGNPIRLLDDARTFRSWQLNLSADELGMLDTAVARITGPIN